MFVLDQEAQTLKGSDECVEITVENKVEAILKNIRDSVIECLKTEKWDARIYCGISNDRIVKGVELNHLARERIEDGAKEILNDLREEQPAIQTISGYKVVTCNRVSTSSSSVVPVGDLWIVEGRVPPKPKFVQHSTVSFSEGRNIEFKAGRPYRQIVEFVVACLNTEILKAKEYIRGHIYLGIDDHGRVEGLKLNKKGVDETVTNIGENLEKIRPQIQVDIEELIAFHSVYENPASTSPLEDRHIIEVTVPDADSTQPYFTGGRKAFVRRDSRNKEINAQDMFEGWWLEPGPPTPPHVNITVNVFPNPYAIAERATNDMFKGRENEIDDLLDAIANRTHMAIFGLQRMGKTSLIEETLMDRIKQHDDLKNTIRFVKVDFQGYGSSRPTIKAVLDVIVTRIAEEISPARAKLVWDNIRALNYNNQRGEKDKMLRDFTRILINTLNNLRAKKIVLFLDEFSELCQAIEENEELSRKNPDRDTKIHVHEIGVDVDLMHWFSALFKNPKIKEKLVFILAVRPFVAEYDKNKNLQLFKLMNSTTIYHLDKPAAIELMTEPLRDKIDYAEGCVDYLYELTAGHPYLIQLFLLNIINRIRREKRCIVEKDDITRYEDRIISEGPGQQAHFDVLDSDYSVDAVMKMKPEYAKKGKRILGLMAKLGSGTNDGLVEQEEIIKEFVPAGMTKQDIINLLAQLRDAKIILEKKTASGKLAFRFAIPLLQKRYIKQNMYERYS